MSQINSVSTKNGLSRFVILLGAAVALWAALPFVFDFASTTTHAHGAQPTLVASLTGDPIGEATPRGFASYYVAPTGTPDPARKLVVSVSNINLPSGTQLQVNLNGAPIGMITLDNEGRGFLALYTANGGTVPMVVAGDTLTVGAAPAAGNTTYLSGAFDAPPSPSPTSTHTPWPTPSHTPWPTPSHTPFPSPSPTGSPIPEIHLYASLAGDPIGDVTPRGLGRYEEEGSNSSLDVFVSFVNLPDDTALTVNVGNAASQAVVGTITLHGHAGALHLDTAHGDTVPVITADTPISITNSDVVVLAGMFSDTPPTPFPTPSHTPFPTPSHTPFPSPTGTPGPARAFAARLKGANEVPPVTTDGLGIGFVCLNAAETQIRVNIGTRNLSGPATAITINGPALPTENGPVIFTMTLPANSLHYATQTFDVTADQVAQLRAGSWYVQVATAANVDGEIRGQLNAVVPHGGGGHMGGSGAGDDGGGSGSGDDFSSTGTKFLLVDDNDGVTYPGDFNGDGVIDTVVFYQSLGSWYINLGASSTPLVYRYDRQSHPFTSVIEP